MKNILSRSTYLEGKPLSPMVARDPEVDWLPYLRLGIMGYEPG